MAYILPVCTGINKWLYQGGVGTDPPTHPVAVAWEGS